MWLKATENRGSSWPMSTKLEKQYLKTHAVDIIFTLILSLRQYS